MCYSHFGKMHAPSFRPSRLESVQDFLIKLDMKPCMHLVEISIFSLNHVIMVRLTKLCTFKVIFSVLKSDQIFLKKKFYEEYLTRRPTFIKKCFLKFLIFKILYFLKLCPIFVGTIHDLVSLMMKRFSEKMLISTRCIHGFMSNLIKKS